MLHKAVGDRVGQAIALSMIGWQHGLLGEHEQTLVYCKRALTMLQELGDQFSEAGAWTVLVALTITSGNLPRLFLLRTGARNLS